MLGWLKALDCRVSVRTLIWGFWVAFLIHDVEEVVTVEAFARQHLALLPKPLLGLVPDSTAQFAASVAIVLVLWAVVCGLAASAPHPGWQMQLFAMGVAALLLNVLTHVGQAGVWRSYAPGVFGAVLVALPYGLYAVYRLRAERLVTAKDLAWAFGLAAVLTVPLIVGVLALGKLLPLA